MKLYVGIEYPTKNEPGPEQRDRIEKAIKRWRRVSNHLRTEIVAGERIVADWDILSHDKAAKESFRTAAELLEALGK